jgi:parallel beta-helix repeat protein
VTVRDANNNPVPTQTVAIAATGSGNTVTQPSSTTDANGAAFGFVASTAAEVKTLTAVINPGPSQIAVPQSATVRFEWIPANTYFVRTSGTDPAGCTGGTTPGTAWRTIGKAASCAAPGSKIYVGAGTYNESVVLTTSGTSANPIQFVADTAGTITGDAGEVVVDADGVSQAIQILGANWITIEGFTLHGATSGAVPSGGIRIGDTPCSNITLRNNVVYGNTHGIYVFNASTVTIEHNCVSANAFSVGDGIVVRASSSVTIRDNLVYANAGAGISAQQASLGLVIESNVLYANAGDQARIDGTGNSATLRNNIVSDGGQHGISLTAPSTATSTYNDVVGNAAGNWSGLAAGAGDFASDPSFVDPAGPDAVLGGPNCSDDDFHLKTFPPSPAFDAGSANATAITESDGLTLADRTSRSDTVPDGTAPDGAVVNLGYHYPIVPTSPPALDPGDVQLFYGEGTQRQLSMRTFDDSTGTWSAAGISPPTGSTVHFVVAKRSPLASGEQIVVSLADNGMGTTLDLIDWSGVAWSRVFESTAIASANSGRRGFDVAFEAVSGNALVVYSNNTPTPVYRTRTAGTWSAETSLPLNDGGGPNPDPNSGIVQWIGLASRPGRNEIALGYTDTNRDFVVIVWNGTQWLTSTATRLDNNITPYGGTANVENRAFDLAYESVTGDLMAAYCRSSSNGFRWAKKPAASTIFTTPANVNGAPGAAANYVSLASEPGTNRIAACAAHITGGTRPERLGVATWNGTAWVNITEAASSLVDLANTGPGDFPCDVAWVGTTGVAVCVYPGSTTATLDWVQWTGAGGWVVQPTVSMPGKNYTDSVLCLSRSGASRIDVVLSDAAGALYAGVYDGLSWSTTATPLSTVLSTSSGRAFGALIQAP